MIIVPVIQQAPDGLGRAVWKFRVDDRSGANDQIKVDLVYWANQTRPKRRHGWKIAGKHFDAYDRDARNYTPPALPVEVWDAFKADYMSRLTFAGSMGA
jgi:hypothetical protein